MSGVLSAAMARPAFGPSRGVEGLWSAQGLAAMRAADSVDLSWYHNTDFGAQHAPYSSRSPEHGDDWFADYGKLFTLVVSEAEAAIPAPSNSEAAAEIHCMIRQTVTSMLAESGHDKNRVNVAQIVHKVCDKAEHIIAECESRAASRQATSGSSAKVKKAVVFTVGAGGILNPTADEQTFIEQRLRMLEELGEPAKDELQQKLQAMKMQFENDEWRINLSDSDPARFVIVPKTSIRITNVVEVEENGVTYFDVSIKGIPVYENGMLTFKEVHKQRFAVDSDLVKTHGKNPQELAEALRKMTLERALEHIKAEQQRMIQKLQAAPAVAAIRGGEEVSATDLCTFSPNAAALNLLPLHKVADKGAVLTH